MGPCIYCSAPADSKEHWLPRSFGAIKGADTLQDRLCAGCNRALGQELDEELARTGLTGYFRAVHGIRGRPDHSEVSPFHYRAMSAEQPTAMMMPAPQGDHKVLAEVHPDDVRGSVARTLRQLVFKTSDGRVECVPFPPAWKAEQVKAAIRERHLEEAELLEVYLKDDEGPDSLDVRRLLTDAMGMFHALCWYGGDEEGTVKQVELTSGISARYMRALAKVAFHYFLWASRTYRGDEPEFAGLRGFVRNGDGNWRQFVQPTAEPFISQLRERVPTQTSHFLSAEANSAEAFAGVHFFVGPTDVPPASLVRFGRSPSRIDVRWLSSHWVRYYDDKTDGYDGEIEEVDVTSRRIEHQE